MSLPNGLARHLRGMLVDLTKPYVSVLDAGLRVCRQFGDSAWYGLPSIGIGADALEALPFLPGLQDQAPLHLPMMGMPNGRAADVRLFRWQETLVVLLVDVSQEHAVQRELQQHANELRLMQRRQAQLLRELQDARDELSRKHAQSEELNQAKSRFIAAMSHELRTPLATIVGHTGLLLEHESGADTTARSAKVIGLSATHLMSLVDNMLDQASIETGQLALNPVPTRLADVFSDIESMFHAIVQEHGIEFAMDLGAGLPRCVEIDATRLRQVIINLVGNAVKYTSSGFVSVAVDWSAGRLEVRVIDSGPGICDEAKERIFLPFHRELDAGSQPGLGLGLAISYQLVALMGGVLSVGDRPEGGAIFAFSIPVTDLGAMGEERSREQRGRPCALLVDDAKDVRMIYSRVLAKAGYLVLEAENLAEACRYVSTGHPDAIITDLYLDDGDSETMIRRLRANSYAGVILAWSASSLRQDRERQLAAGADDYLVKPVAPGALCATLDEHLRRKETSTTLRD